MGRSRGGLTTKLHVVTDGTGQTSDCAQAKSLLKGQKATAVLARTNGGYRETMEEFVRNVLKKTISISERITPGWVVLAKRWVVEHTFAWLNHDRRLSKDYEIRTTSAETLIMIAHSK